MRPLEIEELKISKEQYFVRLGFHDDGSRKNKQSYARAAFVSAFRSHATLHELGLAIKKDHSSVVYAVKMHSTRLEYQDYFHYFNVACTIRDESPIKKLITYDYEGMMEELNKLNAVVSELSKYKELYLTLKKTFNAF